MKIFVWNGEITKAYHDDATLAVLANSVEEAREIVIKQMPLSKKEDYSNYGNPDERFLTKEPDEVFDLDEPKIVAYNFGADD